MPLFKKGHRAAPSRHHFWSGVRPRLKKKCGQPPSRDVAPAFLNEGARSDLATGQTRKPPTITNDTPEPHGAQSKSVISTTTVVEDEPNRKAMGYRKAPTAVRAGCGQHGRGRVGMDKDEPNRKAMGCRKAPTAVRAGCGQHGRGRVGMDKDEPNRKAMEYRKAPTAVRAGGSQHGRGRVGMSPALLHDVYFHQPQGIRGRGRARAGGFPKIPPSPARPRPQ